MRATLDGTEAGVMGRTRGVENALERSGDPPLSSAGGALAEAAGREKTVEKGRQPAGMPLDNCGQIPQRRLRIRTIEQ